MQLTDFLFLTEGAREIGDGKYKSRCPAHEDHVASLSISEGRYGDRIVLFCHAGCPTREILQSLGLGLRDLYYNRFSKRQSPKAKADRFSYTKTLEAAGKTKAEDLTAEEYRLVLEECVAHALHIPLHRDRAEQFRQLPNGYWPQLNGNSVPLLT